MRHILIKKKVPHNVGRVLLHCVLFYIMGIIGGNIFLNREYVSLFLYLISLGLLGLFYSYYFGLKCLARGLICFGISFLLFLSFPLHLEEKLFKSGESYVLVGQVKKVRETSYYKWITLSNVEVHTLNLGLESYVQIRLPLTQAITIYDTLEVEGECLEREPKMNPSDFDYSMYLRGEKIAATLKMKKVNEYREQTPLIEGIQIKLKSQLEHLFSEDKVGLMEALLLGDDTKLSERTEGLYQAAGISHVICISGFHVGVVISFIMILMRTLSMSYTTRSISMIGIIWLYALLIGGTTSIIRATIMVSIGLIGKCLWQEDDSLTSLALAALILLVVNPYQLFMVGFQLSFMAVISIILTNNEIEKKQLGMEWKYSKWQVTLWIWGSVQLFTWPIIAYHFYEVPFLVSALNLVIIPLFSGIIIGGYLVLGGAFIIPGLAHICSLGIESVLSSIECGLEILTKWPLATLCVGKPSILEYSLYAVSVLALGAVLFGYWERKKLYQVICIIWGVYLGTCWLPPENLKITGLYVGQGDCTIMEIPGCGLVMIDGGNFGKGKVVEDYIKYLGYDEIEGIMVSHSDADHIGGVLELLETPLEIKQIFVSEKDTSEHLSDLIYKCKVRKIPICYLSGGEMIQYGDLKIQCIAPFQEKVYTDINDASLVCKVSYGQFSALFTGDKSKESDKGIYEPFLPVTLLKISHHGSRTGTSKDMLLKLRPRYAMISCGRDNLYGHPHEEVLELLETADIEISRTDQEGAIYYETDGIQLVETSYRKDT